MWRDRLKGVLLISAIGLVALGIVRYIVSHQDELVERVSNLTPEKIEEDVLGTVSQIGKKDGEDFSQEKSQAVKLIEEKTSELIEEISKLPQEQLEVVKKRVLREVCEEVLEEEK